MIGVKITANMVLGMFLTVVGRKPTSVLLSHLATILSTA